MDDKERLMAHLRRQSPKVDGSAKLEVGDRCVRASFMGITVTERCIVSNDVHHINNSTEVALGRLADQLLKVVGRVSDILSPADAESLPT